MNKYLNHKINITRSLLSGHPEIGVRTCVYELFSGSLCRYLII